MLINPQEDRKYQSQAWLGLCLILATLFGLGVIVLDRSYSRLTVQEHSRLQTQARVVSENLIRQLAGVNNALASIRYDMVTGDQPDKGAFKPFSLKALTDAMPGVRGIVILDADGTITFTDQNSLKGRNFRQREYFVQPKLRQDYAALYVSPPFKSTAGIFSVNLGKPFAAANGLFAGVITANLDPDYFEILARSVLYSPDMAVEIVHGAGSLFIDGRGNKEVLGKDLTPSTTLFSRHMASGDVESVLDGASAATGDNRLMVIRTVMPAELRMDVPLVIQVSRQREAVYGQWWDDLTLYLTMFLLVAGASCAGLYVVQQRRAAANAAARERQKRELENARRFELGLNSAEMGLWDWQIDADALTVNARELEMLGRSDDDTSITPKVWRDFIHPDDIQAVYTNFFEHAQHSASPFRVTHRMLHRDGRVLWVLSHAMAIARDASGRVTRVLGTHTDITRRMQIEADVREAAKRLELAVKTGRMGLLDWHVPTGKVRMNARAQEIIGSAFDDDAIQIEAWRALKHPDDAAAVDAEFKRLQRGEPVTMECEYRVRHEDGRYVWIHLRAETIERGELDEPVRVMGTFRDITARRTAEMRLTSALTLQNRTGALAAVGGWEVDVEDHSVQWTEQMYRIHEMAPGTPLTTDACTAYFTEHFKALAQEALAEANASGKAWSLDAQLRTALGRVIWVRVQGEALRKYGKVVRLVGAMQDITKQIESEQQLKDANEQLARLTVTDGLTGVGNRRLFDRTLHEEWQRCARQGQPLALLMVDIDHFKLYNDAYGHQGGDKVLASVAELLQGCVQRSGELVARYGGEEFAILLPCTTQDGAAVVARRCLARIEAARLPHRASTVGPWLTLSIGIASVVPSGEGLAADLIKEADEALYAAKHHGRNRFEPAAVNT